MTHTATQNPAVLFLSDPSKLQLILLLVLLEFIDKVGTFVSQPYLPNDITFSCT